MLEPAVRQAGVIVVAGFFGAQLDGTLEGLQCRAILADVQRYLAILRQQLMVRRRQRHRLPKRLVRFIKAAQPCQDITMPRVAGRVVWLDCDRLLAVYQRSRQIIGLRKQMRKCGVRSGGSRVEL